MNNTVFDKAVMTLLLLALAGALAGVLISLFKNLKKTPYSYKNAGLLGGAIYLFFMIAVSVWGVISGPGLDGSYADHTVRLYATAAQRFILILLPPLLLLFLAVTVSNVILILRERKTPRNFLGAFMGIFMVAASLALTFGWDYIYMNVIMKIYNQGHYWIFIFDSAIPTFFAGIMGYLECIMVGIIVFQLKAVSHKPAYDKDFIIILGCAMSKTGKPYPLLRGRIDKALAFAREQLAASGKQAIFVPSGGQGADECISEAQCIKNYLVENGVDESLILTEDRSTSTLENMRFSGEIIRSAKKDAKVLYSTTNYHVFRSGIYAAREGLDAEGVGSKTKFYFWPNAFVRELIAMLAERRKSHIIVSLLILAFSLLIGTSCYISFFS